MTHPRPLRRTDLRHPVGRAFRDPEVGPWLEKFYPIKRTSTPRTGASSSPSRATSQLRLRGHRLTFQLFAQSPPFAHLLAVYNNYDFSGPLELVRKAAGLSEHAVPVRMAAGPEGARV